jgi:hypothetical protein
MAWQTVPGLAGKLYVPDPPAGGRKSRCPDCFACQRCGTDRCAVCGPAPKSGPPAPKSFEPPSSQEVLP